MSKLIEMLRNQAGRYSIARVCSIVTFVMWILTWMYTLLLGKTYSHFDSVTIAMLIMMFVTLLNKGIESKLLNVKIEGGK